MPLIIAPVGIEVTLVRCTLEPALKRHLEDLGLLSGVKVKVIKENEGDVIIQIKESRIALNKQLASQIFVH